MGTAADPHVAAALSDLRAAGENLLAVGLVPADGIDALEVIRDLETSSRIVGAAQVRLLDEIDRRGLHRADGHGSAKVMVRHAANLSDAEALRRAKAQRAMRDLPAVMAAFESGTIGFCQVQRVARVHANVRVRHLLVEVDVHVAVLAARLPYRTFDAHLTNWERLADEDGAGDQAERDHQRRDFRIGRNVNGSGTFDGGVGSLHASEMREIHQHYTDAELEADWADARERLGDAATFEDLSRNDAQRRADALLAIMRDAAAAQASRPGGSVIVTNIVMDLETFERHLRDVCSDTPNTSPDPRLATFFDDLMDPAESEPDSLPEAEAEADTDTETGVGYRCGTIDGSPIDATEATFAALLGHVRRVVVGADGVVLDMGRRARLFTGARQLAVRLSSTTCIWTGCHVPTGRCQSDHLEAYNGPQRGRTSPDNGAPTCGKHNRFKEHGFTVWRDQRGRWHIQRPDGTEIT